MYIYNKNALDSCGKYLENNWTVDIASRTKQAHGVSSGSDNDALLTRKTQADIPTGPNGHAERNRFRITFVKRRKILETKTKMKLT
jgi:hypothetical protein